MKSLSHTHTLKNQQTNQTTNQKYPNQTNPLPKKIKKQKQQQKKGTQTNQPTKAQKNPNEPITTKGKIWGVSLANY